MAARRSKGDALPAAQEHADYGPRWFGARGFSLLCPARGPRPARWVTPGGWGHHSAKTIKEHAVADWRLPCACRVGVSTPPRTRPRPPDNVPPRVRQRAGALLLGNGARRWQMLNPAWRRNRNPQRPLFGMSTRSPKSLCGSEASRRRTDTPLSRRAPRNSKPKHGACTRCSGDDVPQRRNHPS